LIGIQGISNPILSRFYGRIAELRLPKPILRALIQGYIRKFNVNMDEVEKDLQDFDCMDSFFTRTLREGARSISEDPSHIIACADGKLLAPGPISQGALIQAKGHEYSVAELIGDDELAAKLEGGFAYTIYLSPRDYHRVHTPVGGKVVSYRYIPGQLLPVFPFARENVDRLFCRNERLIIRMETQSGTAVVVFVGATFVGKISMSFAPLRTNTGVSSEGEVLLDAPVELRAGEELGAFHMGSTTVVLHEGSFEVTPGLSDDTEIMLGTTIGTQRNTE